jgi:hypothetical protein
MILECENDDMQTDFIGLSVVLEDPHIYQLFRKITDLREIRPCEKLGVIIGRMLYLGKKLAIMKMNERVSDDELTNAIGDQVHLIIAGFLINGNFYAKLQPLNDLIGLLNPTKSYHHYTPDKLVQICSLPLLVTCLKYSGHVDLRVRYKVSYFYKCFRA